MSLDRKNKLQTTSEKETSERKRCVVSCGNLWGRWSHMVLGVTCSWESHALVIRLYGFHSHFALAFGTQNLVSRDSTRTLSLSGKSETHALPLLQLSRSGLRVMSKARGRVRSAKQQGREELSRKLREWALGDMGLLEQVPSQEELQL